MHFAKGFHRARTDRERAAFDYAEYGSRAIEGKTLCVIGVGGIGREIARLGKALGIAYCTIATHLIEKAGYPKSTAHTGAVTLIQRFGSALTKSPGAILNNRRLVPTG